MPANSAECRAMPTARARSVGRFPYLAVAWVSVPQRRVHSPSPPSRPAVTGRNKRPSPPLSLRYRATLGVVAVTGSRGVLQMPELRCYHCREPIPAGVQAVHIGSDGEGRPVLWCGPCVEPVKLCVVTRACRGCGRELSSTSWNACPPYCSIACWCEANVTRPYERAAERDEGSPGDEPPLPPEPERECAQCGATLEGARSTTVYCSGSCRQKAYRTRLCPRKHSGDTPETAAVSVTP